MQLDKIVNYHKALADPTRIKLLLLLAEGELHGQALAEKLCVSTATVTHHATKLREVSLIRERRDKNTVYFSLNDYFLRSHAGALVEMIDKRREEGGAMTEPIASELESEEKLRQSVLRNFITADGRLKHIPAQLKKKLIVLEHLARQLEKGRAYPEKELNEWIKRYHDDFATLRRELIMHQYMYREKEVYELNPPELWTRWQALH